MQEECNLMVNYVPPSYTKDMFRAMFEPFGQIAECRLIVDPTTQASKGYGFVRFTTPDAAQAAIDGCNGLQVLDKRLKVHKAAAGNKLLQHQVYVAGFDTDTFTPQAIQSYFACFGNVTEVRHIPSKPGKKGVCFVSFASHEEAQAAIDGANGASTAGGLLTVKWSSGTQNQQLKAVNNATRTGLRNARVAASPYHRDDGMGQFRPGAELSQVPTWLQPTLQQNPYGAIPGSQPRPQATSLIIDIVPPEIDEKILGDMFGHFGAVLSVSLPRDVIGNRLGYAEIQMVNRHEADAAVQGLSSRAFDCPDLVPINVRIKPLNEAGQVAASVAAWQ
eukprot:TRINITY_DN52577_c0_g1_i1.p2 TRINITY_DN52577_c0_g1~~TRINITY_DN52577_c0_g1_i1.p2  ORF type:complete len:347 (-),score=18.35 TRINITY_DN52577_c0_g1_i1:1384-2382(-)